MSVGFGRRGLVLLVTLLQPTLHGEEARPPLPLTRATERIVVDGDLSDAAWKDAAVIDRFWETSPGDNAEPKVKTTAWVSYDERSLYIAVKCDDPEPAKIRAPFVDRDNVIGTDDNVAVFIDTRNDKRTAIEFRVNPRGIQGDAVYNDATGSEDFSPDFFYDTAARITAEGWQAEIAIPLSSLRYPKKDPQTWGILVWRNYPRDFRYAFQSSPIPRGSSCNICFTREMTGITGLPGGGHVVAAPYVTAKSIGHREVEGDPTSAFVTDSLSGDAGLDVKWTPGASTVLDATINPDFSQIESDVPQLSVNNRFALFYPEKRPFFLEGVDLLETPIQAVYTRTITSPKWGARVTGKAGGTAYTVLVTQDRGGGSVIVPGPTGSGFAPQDYGSTVILGRVRHDIGRSYASFLLTDREIEGGGHHRALGPDFQLRLGDGDTVTGQLLVSDTATPDLGGERQRAHAARASWNHVRTKYDVFLEYRDYGSGFRADEGFVPQVGIREAVVVPGLRFYPKGLFRLVRPQLIVDYVEDRDSRLVSRTTAPSLFFIGAKNLTGIVELHLREKVRTGGRAHEHSYVTFLLQIDPSRRFTRISLSGALGDAVDYANARVGTGTKLGLTATVRPTDHLQLDGLLNRQTLDVTPEGGREGRLFTADIARLKATYNFSARMFLRLIGQYVKTRRDPSLYGFPVPERDGDFLASALFSYKLNWQTVFFFGYGDDRVVTERNDLVRTGRQVFLKVSYAFQR
jgi:hypothetical protein